MAFFLGGEIFRLSSRTVQRKGCGAEKMPNFSRGVNSLGRVSSVLLVAYELEMFRWGLFVLQGARPHEKPHVVCMKSAYTQEHAVAVASPPVSFLADRCPAPSGRTYPRRQLSISPPFGNDSCPRARLATACASWTSALSSSSAGTSCATWRSPAALATRWTSCAGRSSSCKEICCRCVQYCSVVPAGFPDEARLAKHAACSVSPHCRNFREQPALNAKIQGLS